MMDRRRVLCALAALPFATAPGAVASISGPLVFETGLLPSTSASRGEIMLTVSLEDSPFLAAVQELRRGFETGDVLERFDRRLLGELQSTLFGDGVGELCKFGAVTACGAGKACLQLLPGRLLTDCLAALRALTGKPEIHDHEGLPSRSLKASTSKSTRGERPS